MKKGQDTISVYANGTCSTGGDAGGWGAITVLPDGTRNEKSGAIELTTNNRMDLLAACNGLEGLLPGSVVEILTDSQYLRAGIERHMSVWKDRKWRSMSGALVANHDLWKRLDAAMSQQLAVTVSPITCRDDFSLPPRSFAMQDSIARSRMP
jgi:Ribonuclease HI